MRTRKPPVSRPATVEGKGRVHPPTIRNRLVRGKAEGILTAGPEGVRHDLVVGTSEARALVRLDNALLAARTDAVHADLDFVLASLNDYRPATGDVARLAQECIEAYRRPPRQSRGRSTRARCFFRLAVALGLSDPAGALDEPHAAIALQHRLADTRRTMGAPRPE